MCDKYIKTPSYIIIVVRALNK